MRGQVGVGEVHEVVVVLERRDNVHGVLGHVIYAAIRGDLEVIKLVHRHGRNRDLDLPPQRRRVIGGTRNRERHGFLAVNEIRRPARRPGAGLALDSESASRRHNGRDIEKWSLNHRQRVPNSVGHRGGAQHRHKRQTHQKSKKDRIRPSVHHPVSFAVRPLVVVFVPLHYSIFGRLNQMCCAPYMQGPSPLRCGEADWVTALQGSLSPGRGGSPWI